MSAKEPNGTFSYLETILGRLEEHRQKIKTRETLKNNNNETPNQRDNKCNSNL